MLAITGERSVIPAIIPPGTAHIHPVISIAFRTTKALVQFSGMISSLALDYLVR
ncbi:MAG: hypothetical protein IPG04_09335, partial [Polyangiaceae bacterium]|nr:hypothetical protein [Polyangiaceae bacterium]